jgi:pimeloyl-ACP methyl ester carboxylesterase/DNA-binding winged helix-turn-helix (wHTH) protein
MPAAKASGKARNNAAIIGALSISQGCVTVEFACRLCFCNEGTVTNRGKFDEKSGDCGLMGSSSEGRGMHTFSPKTLCFGAFALDLQRCLLLRGTEEIQLRPKSFDLLRHLAENPGRLLSKDELMKAVWPNLFVTDDSLVKCVTDIRHALGDDAQRIIRTMPRRGYMFVGEVTTNDTDGQVDAATSRNQDVTFCRTRDGVNLAVACVGEGRPLVRATTWITNIEYEWQTPLRTPLLRFLADRFRLIRYDGRGGGLSDRNVADISFATFEEDLDTIVDALHLHSYALLGMSQGAATAIAHAVRYPERVTKMVIYGGYALGRNRRGSAKEREMAQAYLTLMGHGWGDEHSAFLRSFSSMYLPGASTEQIKWYAELQRMATSAENAVRLRAACDEIDVMDLLPKISVPTLVLHARHDNVVPFEEGRRIAASIPEAKFVSLESENHVLLSDEPAWPKFIHEIEAFLSD